MQNFLLIPWHCAEGLTARSLSCPNPSFWRSVMGGRLLSSELVAHCWRVYRDQSKPFLRRMPTGLSRTANESALSGLRSFKRPNFWQELHISHKLCEQRIGEYSQSAIQLPRNPHDTRCGSRTRATSLLWKSDASIITKSLPTRTGS